MKEKRNDAELKTEKLKRDYDYERRVSDIYFDLFFVFVAAGNFFMGELCIVFLMPVLTFVES